MLPLLSTIPAPSSTPTQKHPGGPTTQTETFLHFRAGCHLPTAHWATGEGIVQLADAGCPRHRINPSFLSLLPLSYCSARTKASLEKINKMSLAPAFQSSFFDLFGRPSLPFQIPKSLSGPVTSLLLPLPNSQIAEIHVYGGGGAGLSETRLHIQFPFSVCKFSLTCFSPKQPVI